MSFIKKINLRRIAAVAAVSGTVFFGGNAVVNAAPSNDGVWAFREAYTAQKPDTRVFEQDMTLITTNFHLDVDSKAQILKDGSFRMGGQFNCTYTNLDNEMTLYVQRRGKWNKMLLPGLPSSIAFLWKTTDPVTANGVMNAVKNVEVLKDTPDVRILNVTLDGAKLADILEKDSQATFANLSGNDLAEQKTMFQRWLAAFKANDITFAWTINKPSWTTATASFDLTPIIRAYARYVLDESAAGKVVLTDEERDLLDAMGYYSELKSYSTEIPPEKSELINAPTNLEAIPENDNALNDVFYEITTTVEK